MKLFRPQIQKKIQLPGDKSISHRCLLLAALASGESQFEGLSSGQDVVATQNVLKQLGVRLESYSSVLKVYGQGKYLKTPDSPLNCQNAGTLMRLLTGLLVGQNFSSTLIGDDSLMERPMERVAQPLMSLGAQISLRDGKAPIQMTPSLLTGGEWTLETASAQVKSALMLAALFADSPVVLRGKIHSRDHTENLFPLFNIPIERSDIEICINPHEEILPVQYKVPKDPSAAAFWCVGSLLAQQELTLEDVCLNPTRLGFLQVLQRAGVAVEQEALLEKPEREGRLKVFPSQIQSFEILEKEIPSLVDEIPVLALLASQAPGESVFYNVRELRYKETDRIRAIEKLFESLGMTLTVEGDTLKIPGGQIIRGGVVDSYGDHRIAMTAAMAALGAESPVEILGAETAEISDPYFWGNFV